MVIAAITTIFEVDQIPKDQLRCYLLVRVFLISLGLPSALLLRKKPYSTSSHVLFGSLIIAYSMHGQWYRPFYEYTYFQAMVFYTLLLYPPKKMFIALQVAGAILFTAVYTYRFDTVVLHSNTTLSENYLGLAAFALTLFGIFKVFSEERLFKEQALARFGLLGKHSASILHDLKSTIAVPRIYLDLVDEELEAGNVEKARSHLKDCLVSMDSMQTVIMRLNQIGSLTQFSLEKMNAREVVDEVLDLLRAKLIDVRIEIRGDLWIEANRSFIFSLILNVVLNSLENFGKRMSPDPVIKISMSGRCLTFEDNGGGFASDVLERVRSGVSASTKIEMSGLGLFLLREGVRNMGGKMFFSNSPEGAVIEIQFKS